MQVRVCVHRCSLFVRVNPQLYCDFHGHSRRKNVFLYGCRIDDVVGVEQVGICVCFVEMCACVCEAGLNQRLEWSWVISSHQHARTHTRIHIHVHIHIHIHIH